MERIEVTDAESAKVFHRAAHQFYEKAGYNNFVPLLVVVPKGSKEDECMVRILDEMRPGKAYQIVQRALLELDDEIDLIAISTDAYVYHDIKDEEGVDEVLKKRQKESFKDMFDQQNPNVSECLTTMVLTPNGNYSMSENYRYTPAEGFEWEELKVAESVTGWDFERLVVGKPQLDFHGRPICPVCGHFVPNDTTPGEYPGALSRVDNKTEICSACGTKEALELFFTSGKGLKWNH